MILYFTTQFSDITLFIQQTGAGWHMNSSLEGVEVISTTLMYTHYTCTQVSRHPVIICECLFKYVYQWLCQCVVIPVIVLVCCNITVETSKSVKRERTHLLQQFSLYTLAGVEYRWQCPRTCLYCCQTDVLPILCFQWIFCRIQFSRQAGTVGTGLNRKKKAKTNVK